MSQAQSMSLSHFTKAVQSAVKAAKLKHPKFNVELPEGITFSYLIRGFPVPETVLANVTLGEAQAFANEIAAHVSEHAGVTADAKTGAQGAVYSFGRHVICGIPPAESFLMKE